MGISWREDLRRRWAVIVYADPFTTEQWRTTLSEIFAHPIGAPPLRLLVDRRYAYTPQIEFVRRLYALVDAHADRLHGGRVAIVVAGKPGDPSFIDVVATAGGNTELTIDMATFTDWRQAEEWLDRSYIAHRGT